MRSDFHENLQRNLLKQNGHLQSPPKQIALFSLDEEREGEDEEEEEEEGDRERWSTVLGRFEVCWSKTCFSVLQMRQPEDITSFLITKYINKGTTNKLWGVQSFLFIRTQFIRTSGWDLVKN